MFSYRSLLKQAWGITWRHKYLWFFGLFAALTAAGGSIEYQVVTSNLNQNLVNGNYSYLNSVYAWGLVLKGFFVWIIGFLGQNILVIINSLSLLLLTAALLGAIVFLAIVSQAGLIDSIKKLSNSKKKEKAITISEGLTNGRPYFWSVLGLNLVIRILANFVFFIISLPLLFMVLKDSSAFAAVYTILFVIFIPVAVSLSLMVKFAISYNVLEKESFINSLEKGWKLFMKNWLVSLEMAIILFILNFVVLLLLMAAITLFIFPLFLVSVIYQVVGLTYLMLFFTTVAIILVGSSLVTFQISTWTTLFIRLKDKGGIAKLERFFEKNK